MKLDPTKAPESCVHLIPLAERWGIGNDVEREDLVWSANPEELQVLVDAIRGLPDDGMFDWLAGPESYSTTPTDEYLAFTCMTMAYDSARVRLERLGNTSKNDPGVGGSP
jgi:hypothetical protein